MSIRDINEAARERREEREEEERIIENKERIASWRCGRETLDLWFGGGEFAACYLCDELIHQSDFQTSAKFADIENFCHRYDSRAIRNFRNGLKKHGIDLA